MDYNLLYKSFVKYFSETELEELVYSCGWDSEVFTQLRNHKQMAIDLTRYAARHGEQITLCREAIDRNPSMLAPVTHVFPQVDWV